MTSYKTDYNTEENETRALSLEWDKNTGKSD